MYTYSDLAFPFSVYLEENQLKEVYTLRIIAIGNILKQTKCPSKGNDVKQTRDHPRMKYSALDIMYGVT